MSLCNVIINLKLWVYIFQIITLVSPQRPNVQYEPNLILACDVVAEARKIAERYRKAIIITHPCGRNTTLTFTDSVDPLICGITFTRSWKVGAILFSYIMIVTHTSFKNKIRLLLLLSSEVNMSCYVLSFEHYNREVIQVIIYLWIYLYLKTFMWPMCNTSTYHDDLMQHHDKAAHRNPEMWLLCQYILLTLHVCSSSTEFNVVV